MSTKPYFCYAPTDDTMIFYDTAEEARDAAIRAIEDASDGEWHEEVGGVCWGRVIESAAVDIQHEHGPECSTPEDGFDCPWGLSRDYDYTGEVKLAAHAAPEPPDAVARLAAAEAEVARQTAEIERLRAELAEAEERAAGPFFVCCAAIEDITSYGLRLESALEDVLAPLGEHLEDMYAPGEWTEAVARWEVTVGHGAMMEPYIDDDGEPALMVKSAAGWWHYDLTLTVTDGSPVLTATRRGAR